MATNPTGGTTSLVERVRNILMTPKTEWPRIDAEPATIGGIYTSYVMILAAIPPVAGAIGLLLFGFSMLGISYRPTPQFVIGSAVVQYLLSLVGIYVLAMIVEALAPTFGGVKDRVKAFKVCAYASTAGWVAGIFGIIPQLGWLALIGGLYGLYLLYLGLPVLMKVAADKSVGYILAVIVAAIVLYVVVGMIAASLIGAFVGLPGPAPGTITIGVPG
jgi:Yip1 domain